MPRLATAADVPAIAACARAAFEHYVPRIGRPPAPMVADFHAAVAAGTTHIVECDGEVVGYCVICPHDVAMMLENVAVLPSRVGQGIGGVLLAFVERAARGAGLRTIELYTNALMTENLALYRYLGYREFARRHESGFDRVYLRKRLEPAISGLNHVTLSVSDLKESCDFYVTLLTFRLRARWARGVYLSCGELWLCLSSGRPRPARDYTHVAFSIDQADFDAWRMRLDAADVPRWKENTSEGNSIYFLDPDGHQCELHAGDLASRLAALRQAPCQDLELFE